MFLGTKILRIMGLARTKKSPFGWPCRPPHPKAVACAFYQKVTQAQTSFTKKPMTPTTYWRGGNRSAMLVSGEDRFGHWDADPEPQVDLDPTSMAYLEQIWANYRDESVTVQASSNANS